MLKGEFYLVNDDYEYHELYLKNTITHLYYLRIVKRCLRLWVWLDSIQYPIIGLKPDGERNRLKEIESDEVI